MCLSSMGAETAVKWANRALYLLLFVVWAVSYPFIQFPFVWFYLGGITAFVVIALFLPDLEPYPKELVLQSENNLQE